MNLLVVHHHFRPGGVRRVIELALPAIATRLGQSRSHGTGTVQLVGGEAPDRTWLGDLAHRLAPLPVTVHPDPVWSYLNEQSRTPLEIARRARRLIAGLLEGLAPEDTVVWLHNPGLGRNLPVVREWTRTCTLRGIRLVFHHHDWWFDNRWQRWPELRESGGHSLQAVARHLLADTPVTRHAGINQADAAALATGFRHRAAWLPNPADPTPRPTPARTARARRWLAQATASSAPLWLLPCRLLRRKNIAEALLLMRWLQPDARLATTGGPSSTAEQPCADALAEAAVRHAWPLHLSILAGTDGSHPPLPDLLAASDVIAFTSLAEGFGLPFLEAAAAGRPLVARRLDNILPDLQPFGFRFPDSYEEVRIPPDLFHANAERRRQEERFDAWRKALPRSVRPRVPTPAFLETPGQPAAFSRLTLTAQLEVLAHAPADSLQRCQPHNPWLAARLPPDPIRPLQPLAWPPRATRSLGVDAYARRWMDLALHPNRAPLRRDGPDTAQAALLDARFSRDNLYPLLWTPEP